METKSILLVGGSPEPSSAATILKVWERCDIVVAVDSGLDAVLDAGLACDLFVGDADSVSERGAAFVHSCEEGRGGPVREAVRFDPHKDDTDLGLALRIINERWLFAFVACTCLTGGRPDHALAVLGRLASCKTLDITLDEDGFHADIVRSPSVTIMTDAVGQTFSFIPLSERAVVSEAGMRWNLDNREVSFLSDLGISNVIESESASFSCHEGVVVTWLFDDMG